MSYTFSFADNGIYGADDMNTITKRLVTAGVADVFEDGVPYNTRTCNELGMAVYTDGVVPEHVNALRVSMWGDEVTIAPGTAFFKDGAVFTVSAGGHTLSAASNTFLYVYLKNDLEASGTCYPVCSRNEPEGDYVLLAQISEDGNVTDRRKYAKGKLPGYASDPMPMLISDVVKIENGVPEQKVYDLGSLRYRFLLARKKGVIGSSGFLANYALGLYDFSDGTYMGCDFPDPNHARFSLEGLTVYRKEAHVLDAVCSVSGSTLTLTFTYRHPEREPMDEIPLELYLI